MTDLDQSLRENLKTNLDEKGYALVDLITLPPRENRMLIIRTLQDALDRFDSPDVEPTHCYLVQVKPKTQASATASEDGTEVDVAGAVYHDDGKLNIDYLFRNAEILLNSNEPTLARNIFRTIFLSGDQCARALFGIGRCYEVESKLKEAEQAFEESIAFVPALPAFEGLIRVLLAASRDEYAAEIAERALRSAAMDGTAKFELHKTAGNCWTRAKRIDRAVPHFRKALFLKPAADEVQSNLGSAFLQDGKTEEARLSFQDALASNPSNAKASFGLGTVYLLQKNKEAAYKAFHASLVHELLNPMALFYLVKLAYELKEFGPAEQIVSAYIERAPVNANLLYSLAGLQYHLGQLHRARQTAQRVLQMDACHEGARELLTLLVSKTSVKEDGWNQHLKPN